MNNFNSLENLANSLSIHSHKQQIMEYKLRMDALQKEYLKERQELSNKLLQAIRSHEVCTEPVTFYPPGLSNLDNPDWNNQQQPPRPAYQQPVENPSGATAVVTVQQNTTIGNAQFWPRFFA